MPTLSGLLRDAAAKLAECAIETPMLDARLLLCHALGCTREELLLGDNRKPTAQESARFSLAVARRAEREPLSHILGVREFYGREFAVSKDVLDPRADSETLIEAVLKSVRCPERSEGSFSRHALPEILRCAQDDGSALRILDLGAGSGCLLLTLLAELPYATGVGVDLSEAALAMARGNAGRLGLEARATFVQGRWIRGLQGKFDVVVSNPPYIPEAEIAALMPEVARFEPKLALDGGKDGLDCYREIANDLVHVLAPQGMAALEIGAGQQYAVAGILEAAGFYIMDIRHDLAGIPRCIIATRQT